MLMYPDALDRDRLVGKLLQQWAAMTDRKQDTLAAEAGISQSTISKLENLWNYPTARSREPLLKYLTSGLHRSRAEADAVLWLLDGKPVGPKERGTFFKEDSASPSTPTDDNLRRAVIDCLGKAIPHKATRTNAGGVVFAEDDDALLAGEDILLQMEEKPGHTMRLMSVPSRASYPSDFYKAQAHHLTKDERAVGMLVQRNYAFLENLKKYGAREIFSKEGLRAYVNEEAGYQPLTLAMRRRHVEHLITLLDTYAHYWIGLVNDTPPLEMGIKSTVFVFMRGVPKSFPPYGGKNLPMPLAVGPRYVYFDLCDEDDIGFHFLLDFERLWDVIPDQDRAKAEVRSTLKALLSVE
jgi:hypothetical protein